jgi:hypothetical protein
MSKLDFLAKYGDGDLYGKELDKVPEDKFLKSTEKEHIEKHKFTTDIVNKLMQHKNKYVAEAAYHNKAADKSLGADSHHSFSAQALAFHGTSKQVDKYIKSDDPVKQAAALHNENSTKEHLKQIISKELPENHELYSAVVDSMIKHKHYPKLIGNKPTISVRNETLSKLPEKEYDKLKSSINVTHSFHKMDTMPVLTSKNSKHVNDAIQGHEKYHSSLHTGHHLILNRPDINNKSLEHIGVMAGKSNSSEHDGLAVTAMRHQNITKDAADKILDANQHNKFINQLKSIHAKIK